MYSVDLPAESPATDEAVASAYYVKVWSICNKLACCNTIRSAAQNDGPCVLIGELVSELPNVAYHVNKPKG